MNRISLKDEHQLVRLLQSGDSHAFRAVYDYYWPVMYSHALRMLQQEDEAEDLTQELFLSLYMHLPSLDSESGIGAWLFVTLRNKILNHLRNQRTRLAHLEHWVAEELRSGRQNTSPLEQVQLKEMEALLEFEVRQMPQRMREIFELSRKEYLSHKEIAFRLQISDKTVKTQINNALRILRSRIRSIPSLLF